MNYNSSIDIILINTSDKIDDLIISCLTENARISANDISKKLGQFGFKRTSRAVSERIKKLEKDGKIAGYTLKTQPKNFENVVIRLILISFKTSPVFNEHISLFTNYLQKATFAVFAARVRGEYDWINIKIFPNTQIANEESDLYRTIFGDIIDKYEAFDLTIVKAPSFLEVIGYSPEEFHKFCEKVIKKSSHLE